MINGILFQGFEWYLPDDGNYYKDMIKKLPDLKRVGVSAIWLPPVTKATGTNDVGYGIYDLYDLGEFDQKGSVRTKYGTKEELHELIDAIHDAGMQVYADVVINHKAGADEEEEFEAVKVNPDDRREEIEDPKTIKGWTGFTFPGRGEKYSSFKWNFNHFSGVDYDSKNEETGIFKIKGENKGWSWEVSDTHGNFDYLMFADIDHAHPDVKEEIYAWADWFIKELKLDGLRFDAVKHIDASFMEEFTGYLHEIYGDDFYLLGEYWDTDMDIKERYMQVTRYNMSLFDVSLHFKFYEAAKNSDGFDLRDIFSNTVTSENPPMSVTFVDNHDSEPGQALESTIDDWFKEIAYGIILLRKDGYPCLFYGDYYGINGDYNIESKREMIDPLALIRKKYSYGDQDDYFNEQYLIGWLRHGTEEFPHKLAVVVSIKEKRSIKMFFGDSEVGKVYVDALGYVEEKVTIDDEGYGEVSAQPGKISCWLEEGFELE